MSKKICAFFFLRSDRIGFPSASTIQSSISYSFSDSARVPSPTSGMESRSPPLSDPDSDPDSMRIRLRFLTMSMPRFSLSSSRSSSSMSSSMSERDLERDLSRFFFFLRRTAPSSPSSSSYMKNKIRQIRNYKFTTFLFSNF